MIKLVNSQNRTIADYKDYESKVLSRAAASIGCDPDYLDKTDVPDYYLDGLSQFEAAALVETNLQEECFYFNTIHNYDLLAPF